MIIFNDPGKIFSLKAAKYIDDNCKKKDLHLLILGVEPYDVEEDEADIIACPMTDSSHIRASGIPIVDLHNAPELKNVYATAEHIMFLIFNALRANAFATDTFNRPARPYRELHGKFIYVYGAQGRIATQLKRMLSWISWSKYMETDLGKGESKYQEVADIIISCIDNRPENRNFFDKNFFSSLKKNAIFINTSRGDVVDEKELLRWLVENPDATAMVDVIKSEHNPENSLLWLYRKDVPNLFITPHIGGYTIESRQKTDMIIANKIVEYFNDK